MEKVTWVVSVITAVFIIQSGAVQVLNCVTGELDDNLVDIVGCPTPPCQLYRNKSYNVTIKFTPETTINSLVTDVDVQLKGSTQWSSFAFLDKQNACENIKEPCGREPVSCPLEKGHNYLYEKFGNVSSIIPVMEYRLRWALVQDETKIACFELDCQIK